MADDGPVARAVAYVEEHLKEPVSLRAVAQVAGYSPFHFHRLFLAVTGETLAAYVRRRRLMESARELAEPGKRAIDVALAYQYDSQEAFIRAFRRQFGVTPGRYRRSEGTAPPTSVSGGKRMEPRFVEGEPMTIVGMIYFGENQQGEIGRLWGEFIPRIDRIPHRIKGPSYGFCFMDDQLSPNFWYMAAFPVEQITQIPSEMVAKTVPAHTYAVFTHQGPVANLGETYARAYQTWLPSSDYEPAAYFDFERYDDRFNPNDPANSILEVWLPVRRKA